LRPYTEAVVRLLRGVWRYLLRPIVVSCVGALVLLVGVAVIREGLSLATVVGAIGLVFVDEEAARWLYFVVGVWSFIGVSTNVLHLLTSWWRDRLRE
jgi:hypothetical protein